MQEEKKNKMEANKIKIDSRKPLILKFRKLNEWNFQNP
jgi:hypothetical protein